jgi:ribulose-phosphate 3-epimerase
MVRFGSWELGVGSYLPHAEVSSLKRMTLKIAPSLLSADFARLGSEIAAAEQGGADLLHVDIMDGHFVPNLTMGPPVVQSIKRVATVPLDVHLMIEEPDRYIPTFVEAGASMISVHVEVLPHLHRTLQLIKSLGAKAGVAINPATPVGAIEEVAADVDHVLVMSVNPGFGGQTFIPRSESKITAVRKLLDAAGNQAPVEVDGGVDLTNAARIVRAGAEILVAGQSIFGTGDPARATRALREVCNAFVGVDGPGALRRDG